MFTKLLPLGLLSMLLFGCASAGTFYNSRNNAVPASDDKDYCNKYAKATNNVNWQGSYAICMYKRGFNMQSLGYSPANNDALFGPNGVQRSIYEKEINNFP